MSYQHTHIVRLLLVCLLYAGGSQLVLAQESVTAPAATPDSYTIRERDMITITVFGEPDLDVVQRIDGDGKVKIPLLGELVITGYTVRGAENYIESQFVEQRYLRDPTVTVSVTDYAPREIILLGEINRPGPMMLPLESDSIDIVDVIARAGDFTGIAKTNDVQIKRKISEGEIKEFRINVSEIITGRESGRKVRSFEVLPGDVIYVPERFF